MSENTESPPTPSNTAAGRTPIGSMESAFQRQMRVRDSREILTKYGPKTVLVGSTKEDPHVEVWASPYVRRQLTERMVSLPAVIQCYETNLGKGYRLQAV